MSVLVIRQHARYAVCRKAQLSRPDTKAVSGLLVELSVHGCRLGNIDERRFSIDEIVTLNIPGFDGPGSDGFEGQVRWVGEGVVGLRFRKAFHAAALERLIRACRGETQREAPMRAFA